ncbi:hypothetical protein H4R99_002948 [Coemansia sp. RSA 1722]|nr:hypothetical protein H4R99_002948 [Coemansia sp. RSA 1722]
MSNYQRRLQGRVVDLGTGCPSMGLVEPVAEGATSANRHMVGIVRCGLCPLTDILREAVRLDIGGIVVTNTNSCGRPTAEFLEYASSVDIPVAFVSGRISRQIWAMQQQAMQMRTHASDSSADGGKVAHQEAFVYISAVVDGVVHREGHVFVHILASTHILLAAAVVLTMLVYLTLACSVGSLRHIPREIAPGIFGTRPEPVDEKMLERLPVVSVRWDVTGACDSDEESRYETPISEPDADAPEREMLQQYLANIIQRCGKGSYSFTEEKSCAICLCGYVSGESVRVLPCKHGFHQKCIDTWLLSKHMTVHCPVCKSSIIDGLQQLDSHGYAEILDLVLESRIRLSGQRCSDIAEQCKQYADADADAGSAALTDESLHAAVSGNRISRTLASIQNAALGLALAARHAAGGHLFGSGAGARPGQRASQLCFYSTKDAALSNGNGSGSSGGSGSGRAGSEGFLSELGQFGSNAYLQQLSARYAQARQLCLDDADRFSTLHAHQRFQPTSQDIFPNTELRLSKVRTYGFDYDYTLARYTDKLPETIYTMIRDVLVDKMQYPRVLKGMKYDKTFAIRGISYDKETGWLFKLDSNYNIAMDTIHYGREPLRDLEEVYSLHNGPHLAPDYVKRHLSHLNDLYSIPEATLLADVIQYFSENNVPFHPRYLAEDIRTAGEYIHKGDGVSVSPLHGVIMSNIDEYLERAPELLQLLETLKREGKRLFLLTNSGYEYVDRGLTHLFGTRAWRDVFDVVIVSARKPSWYLSHRPFRHVPTDNNSGSGSSVVRPWAFVDRFEEGQVYSGGNLMSFTNITGYSDRNVMYFGDHLYSDLRDPSIQKGWFTGAIVSELKYELSVIQQTEYRQSVAYIQLLEKILKHSQQETRGGAFQRLPAEEKEAFRRLLDLGRSERRRVRWRMRDLFNTNFGSVFRTEKYPSLFATKIKSFANVYTADLVNLGAYPSDFVFYPKRMTQAHESRMPEVDDLLEEVLRG